MKATLPILGLAFLVGCGPDIGPTNPDEQVKVLSNELSKASDLLPVKSGNAWTYTMRAVERNAEGQTREYSGTPTLKVTGVNGKNSTIAFIESDKVVSELLLTSTDGGISQRGIKSPKATRSFAPPIPLYHWPMKAGETKEWKGTGFRPALGDNGPMTSTMEYKGESEVDTPAGRMKAHRFDTTTKYTKNSKEFGSTQSLWLVPKVGIVRNIEVVVSPNLIRETELKLQSHTVK